jgi:hypothetical protein
LKKPRIVFVPDDRDILAGRFASGHDRGSEGPDLVVIVFHGQAPDQEKEFPGFRRRDDLELG